jgi:hypothetical protein
MSESSELDMDSETALHMDTETLRNTIANRMAPAPPSASQQQSAPTSQTNTPTRRTRIAFAQEPVNASIASSVQPDARAAATANSANGFAETVSTAPPPPPPLAHMAPSCVGLHGANSRTLVERRSFAELFQGEPTLAASDLAICLTSHCSECRSIVIPVFQRAYCWSQTTTVPAWWRDTANGSRHSCGKLVLKQHADGSHWCLDGQQRLTTTLLLVAAARDTLQQLAAGVDDAAIGLCNSILYTDVAAATAWAKGASLTIAEGQHVAFSRLTPSFVDRKPFNELICEGIGARVAPSTRSSFQWHTMRYFKSQFSALVAGLTPKQAAFAVHDRLVAALGMQLMLIAPQSASDSSVSQIYQWLQESSLLSMGSLLFNPTPGLTMCAADLCRNLCVAPFLDESWDEVERIFNSGWLARVELPCAGNPRTIDAKLALVVARCSPLPPCAIEARLLEAERFLQKDLPGLRLYGRVISLWKRDEAELQAASPTSSSLQIQRVVAERFIERLATAINFNQ